MLYVNSTMKYCVTSPQSMDACNGTDVPTHLRTSDCGIVHGAGECGEWCSLCGVGVGSFLNGEPGNGPLDVVG